MKILILSLVLLLQQKNDSASVWRDVGSYEGVSSRDPRPVSDAEMKLIRKTLKGAKEIHLCQDFESLDSLIEKLRFERLGLSPNAETILVAAGLGCLRGGQGSNGAMWIVQLNGTKVTVLAAPGDGFQGYIYSVPATTSKGYRDIIVGWHNSAIESGLVYFRFDGAQYQTLTRAIGRRDDSGKETITPSLR